MRTRAQPGKSHRPHPLGLGKLELDMMLVVWSREEAGEAVTTVKDVFEVFYPKQGLSYTTVMTVFSRLKKKGWLCRLANGPQHTYRYQSTKPREEAGRQMLDWVAAKYFDGDLVSGLIKEESLI